MVKNYFKTAWRNLLKHKSESIINLVGLCVAFTCALLLFLSVYYEFSYDRFHQNRNSIYHLYFNINKVKEVETTSTMPVPLAPSLKETYPGIKYAVRSSNIGGIIRYKDKKLNKNLKLTDPDFFNMFSFPFSKGNSVGALNGINNIVLTENTSKIIFSEEDPIGKAIELQVDGQWKPFIVSGITASPPENSSISYDMVVRFENDSEYQSNSTRWDNFNHDVYIQLHDGISASAMEEKTASFISKNFAEDIENLKRDGASPFNDGSFIQLQLQSLLDMHTNTKIYAEGGSISKSYLYLLLTIGCLILIIACINFINLGIGRSFTRTYEIGLRKTLGAQRFQLVGQFWTEALLIFLLALLISSGLSYWLIPKYKQLFAMNIDREILLSPYVWLSVIGIFFFVTMLAGGYPAWLMSRFNVVQILKGKVSIRGSQKLRNSLIVVQFSIAILLIICTLVAWQQITYLRTKPLGFNRNQVISIPVEGEVNPTTVLELLKVKLAPYPSLESISGIYNNLGRGLDGSTRRSVMGFDYKSKGISTTWMGVSYDFVKTLDLKIVAGRDFSKQLLTDSNAIVINEAMAEQLGEINPVGSLLPVRENEAPKQVIGIVKNFNFESLHGKIEPLTLVLESNFPPNYILVKVKPEDLSGSMQLLKDAWKRIVPTETFKGSFLDENVDRQYRREEKLGKIFVYGAIIAIILSCMGLLAMVILMIAQRIKEIGIRKVLGASVADVTSLLTKNFIRLVVIAILIASPIAWYFMNNWLQDFAYRITIGWWVFAVAGIAALLLALFTISFQAIKAATANPVKNLRTE